MRRGAVANRVALVGGRHPLVDAHQRFSSTRPAFDSGLVRQAAENRGAILLQLEQLFSQPELIPEVPRDRRRRLARALQHLIDESQQRAVEVLRPEARERLVLLRDDRARRARRRRGPRRRARRPRAAPASCTSTPAPSIVAGTARGGVRDHRNLLVERLDDRHAEAFVRARAEEEIGDVVVGRQLRVGHVPGEVHVRHAEPRARADAASRGTSRSRHTTHQQQPRPRVEVALVRVEVPDDVLDALVGDDAADEQDVGPARRRIRARSGRSAADRGARSPERPAARRSD